MTAIEISIVVAIYLVMFATVMLYILLDGKRAERYITKMRALDREQLEFLGDRLPPDFPSTLARRLTRYSWPDVRLCFSGLVDGERVVSFEYARDFGRGRGWRTAVAVRQRYPEKARAARYGDILERHEDWVMATGDIPSRGNRLSPEKIVTQWASLRTADAGEHFDEHWPSAPEGIVIRPRRRV